MTLPAYEKLGVFYLGRIHDSKSQKDTTHPLLYDSRDLTTHAVCVGMTGSGKTGLCISLLEEAAIDGIPAIAIDPKGDLGNLLLTFPRLEAQDFLPWVDAGAAARKNQTLEEFAAATAAGWKKGLAEWDQDAGRIERLRAAVDVAIYTPASTVGRPLSILRSFAAPDVELRADAAGLRDRVNAAVSGLLGLIGVEADPIQSREHILLANLLTEAWNAGRSLDLAGLIQSIQKPPFDKVGVFDLETFYPAKDRLGLAMAINNLLASPGFATWMQGDPLDIQRLLFTNDGKPRIAIVSIAHLNDAERMFVVTLLLNEVVAWMRRQSGTSSLRALVYMDEIFGYFPPSALPPSKIPLLTLMKQARAFGIGVVLATQNPVDLDYKGLSNAGTWFIGRLQTERDRARIIDGLLGADGGGLDKRELESLLAGLESRVFLMRNVNEDAPVLFRTRWAMSYLRGPLTLHEIGRLVTGGGRQEAEGDRSEVALLAQTANREPPTAAAKPVIPAGVAEFYLAGEGAIAQPICYRPRILGVVRSHFVDRKSGLDVWETNTYVAPPMDDGSGPDWPAASLHGDITARMATTAAPEARFADVPAAFLREQNYQAWSKQLVEYVYRTRTLDVFNCPLLGMTSAPGGSEGDFRAHIALALRERRDAEIDKLRKKYALRMESITSQIQRAEERVERERSQLSQQKMSTVISIGTTLLGALLGRKAISSSSVGRAGTAARSASRIGKESGDVSRAEANVEALQQKLADIETELEAEIGRLQGELDPQVVEVQKVAVSPRKADMEVTRIALLWEAG